jgi:polyhydroxyalkanoate synthesis repressor PhaR
MKAKIPPPVIIKKYENRRLYNTLTSQYINQEQVAQLVRDGIDVRVIDAATGEDITRLILAQIVLEDAKTSDSAFPLDVLRQMVAASGKATQENALRYFKAMMEMYQNAYRVIPPPVNPLEFLPLWAQPRGREDSPQASGRPSGSAPKPASPSSHAAEGQSSDDGDLRRRIEELEAALSRKKTRTKSHKLKSRRKS